MEESLVLLAEAEEECGDVDKVLGDLGFREWRK